MADDVHVHQQPAAPANGGGGPGWVVAVLVIVVLAVVLWFVFARGGADSGPDRIDIDVNLPTTTG